MFFKCLFTPFMFSQLAYIIIQSELQFPQINEMDSDKLHDLVQHLYDLMM